MMEFIELSNGVKVPKVGLGSWALPNDRMTEIIRSAYELGYRKIDTAWKYNNEFAIGNAIRNLGIKRDDIFITSKKHIYQQYYGKRVLGKYIPRFGTTFRKEFDKQCENLGTDYIDLYLLHWPFPMFKKMWKEMVTLYQEGRVRAIGVCSFEQKHFEELKHETDVMPMINQIEINPYNTRKDVIDYCLKNNIPMEAFSCFGGLRRSSDSLMNNPLLVSIAEMHGKTVAQVINRWILQLGAIIIPRSKSRNHQKENIDVFNFELTNIEMDAINSLNENKFVWGNPKLEYCHF